MTMPLHLAEQYPRRAVIPHQVIQPIAKLMQNRSPFGTPHSLVDQRTDDVSGGLAFSQATMNGPIEDLPPDFDFTPIVTARAQIAQRVAARVVTTVVKGSDQVLDGRWLLFRHYFLVSRIVRAGLNQDPPLGGPIVEPGPRKSAKLPGLYAWPSIELLVLTVPGVSSGQVGWLSGP
ncbi:MAG: hypothetical protein O7I42_24445 [Alphaproteobacteria bacterium]|nr:hypothetical protein [Alphaproteobacteria bacterium]